MKFIIGCLVGLIVFVCMFYGSLSKPVKTVDVVLEEVIQVTLPEPEPAYDPFVADGLFELSIEGATGIAPIALPMYRDVLTDDVEMILTSGTIFLIEEEKDQFWRVQVGETQGWVEHKFCMINLPDVIPSIVYDAVNTYEAKYRSSGYDIPDITGQQLYEGKSFNQRLNKETYIVPILYGTAKKINRAQEQALLDNNTLVIHEGYRPFEVQRRIVDAVRQLANSNSEVLAGISKSPWQISWFIYDGVSNHQEGYAVDLSLARILDYDLKDKFMHITSYETYPMHTSFHELSMASSILDVPVTSKPKMLGNKCR